MEVIADLIEALAVIQDRTTTQITLPAFAKLTMAQARPIPHTADLIRGAAVTVPWEGITIHVHPGTVTPGDIFQALVYRELRLAVGEVQASLGYEQIHLPAARVDPGSVTRHGDHDDIRIVPVGETPAAITYLAAGSGARHPLPACRPPLGLGRPASGPPGPVRNRA